MKIDIHTHTRKCKSGDAPTRDISASKFCETLLSTEVRVVAITNHNLFDYAQYEEIRTGLGDEAQVWPGVELDVVEDGNRGHLLVIVSPAHAAAFSEIMEEVSEGSTPDTFGVSVDQVLASFEHLKPLYVAHYRQKKPNLSDEGLKQLLEGTTRPQCVLREVTNSLSAGIYISHGHASIYGSDVHDWGKYESLSRDLPDLRLPVDSFEHFCLLLEKDPTTINTALNRKTFEEVVLQPFDDGEFLKLRIYNDINVVFGAKGTGKSCILKAIARHYSEHGVEAKVFEPASDRLDVIFDVKGRDLGINLDTHGINYCLDEIELVRTAREATHTSLSKYVGYFASKQTNRNAKRMLLKELEPEEESELRRSFLLVDQAAGKTAEFLDFVEGSSAIQVELNADEHTSLIQVLAGLRDRLQHRRWSDFSGWKEVLLLNSAIQVFRREVERKTGSRAKPTTTGFREYALNRMHIELNAAEIVRSMDSKIPTEVSVVGNLGPTKGVLELRTDFKIQNGVAAEKQTSTFNGVKKGTQKKFAVQIREILRRTYSAELFQCIASLNEIEDVETIRTVNELVLFRRYFALNGRSYSPSSGEASMVMLQKELERDSDIYVLDEPERSLGNEYISEVIVPLIKEHARSGKKVFISTHDANIAVRTLPYCSVYRSHGEDGYATYVGNPFSNDLINVEDANDRLDWRVVSMKTLEGGESAFGERGMIYGHA